MLGDLLGRGGMAEVFAGHAVGDHGFQKPVAIKRLLPELANDEVFVERLIEEAKLLVGMQHGNIVSVLDLAREGDDVFLVMEFVDGPSLRQLIKARGSRGISLGVATYIVQSAAAGLEFAHVRPGGAIIHADISPSNLLLTTSGEVRVADFGIARREGLGQGVVEGKWAYMAPEQARGESLTPRSDVFALGVVLYELLTGQHPFGRAVTADERDDQMRVIPPRVVKPSLPHGLDAICMRALAHDPRDRYGRMQHLIDALVEERFTNGYREGASDLAHAIREVAPKSDLASAPRTMHTDRPVTIVTRSLLRDLTPARRSSQNIDRPSSQSGISQSQPELSARASHPPGMMPSGALTVARMVDQAALAEAAQHAAALMDVPAGLRADGTPMPPFRIGEGVVQGPELASVVGGTTVTGHVPGTAVELRNRWTIGVVFVVAILIGIGTAIAIQIHGSSNEETVALPLPAPVVAERTVQPPAPAPAPPAPIQPTIVDPPANQQAVGGDPTPAPPPAPPPSNDPPKDPPPKDTTKPADDPKQPPVRRPQTHEAAVKKTTKASDGILMVSSDPWAWISIQGYPRQETPCRFYLKPGTYTVRVVDGETKAARAPRQITIDGNGKLQKLTLTEDGL